MSKLDRIKKVTSGALLAALLTLGVYAPPARAATLLPNGEQTFLDANGTPLASGCVYFYVPGTNTPKDTYVDPGGQASNTNPVTLDGAGRAIIYGVGTYRQVVKKYPCGVLGEQVWDQLTADTSSGGVIFAGASAGTPNAITVTAPAFTGQDGQVINYISTNTNTGGATFNASGFGNVQIVRDSASGPAALLGGELVATNAVSLIYDATAGVFHILSPVNWPNTSGVPVGTVITHAGFTAPTNYAFAYGQAVSRTAFPALLATLTSAQTGSISSGSPNITGLTDTSQIGYGTVVEATGISGGTTILSCAPTSCIMSANASLTRSGTMTFYPYGAGDGSLTFNLPDYRGLVLVGRDNMGGTAVNLQQVATTVTTTSASTSATVASAAGLAVGMTVNSTNVVPNTKIDAISGTTLTLSVAASGSGIATPARFSIITDPQVLGSTGGSITHAQISSEVGAHAHSVFLNDPGHVHGMSGATLGGTLPNNSGGSTNTTPVGTQAIIISPATTGVTIWSQGGGTGTQNSVASSPASLPAPVLSPSKTINYAVRLVP